MTTGDYNTIVEKLEKIIERYERTDFDHNNYLLYLANGDAINIRVPKAHVAHLLGVDIDYLRNSGKCKADMNSYDILKYFLDQSYSFSKLCGAGGSMSFDQMFSKNIEQKLDAFELNTHISMADLLFIVKYDNEKIYQSSEIIDVSDYYIIRRSKNNSYYVYGIVKVEGTQNYYVPTTSRKYDEEEDFDNFIKRIAYKQELTYPYTNYVTNNFTGYRNNSLVYFNDKLKLLRGVISYSKKYSATPSVASDFSYALSKTASNLANQSNIYNILRLLSDSLRNGNVLDVNTINEIMDDFVIGEDIQNLVDTCNDLICSTSSNNSEASVQYSELNTENQKLKQELEQLKQQLSACKEQIQTMSLENTELKQQNEIYSEQFSIIENACQKVIK